MAKIKIVKSSEIRGRRINFNELFTAQERSSQIARRFISAIGVRKVKG